MESTTALEALRCQLIGMLLEMAGQTRDNGVLHGRIEVLMNDPYGRQEVRDACHDLLAELARPQR